MFNLNKITMDLVIFARTCNYSSGIYNELNISIFYICNRKIINCMTKDELGIKVITEKEFDKWLDTQDKTKQD